MWFGMNMQCGESKQPKVSDRAEERTRDAEDLQRFGYRPQLRRTMGLFSSFAIAFSLISITTGIFAGFQQGIREAGPAVLWSWGVVVFGQFLVALVLAELSTVFPLSGYGYQWTSRLINPHYGFFVGWLLLLQFLTGFPGVCNTLASYLHGFLWPAVNGVSQAPISVPWLTVIVISLVAFVHLMGIRWASRINDAGVIAEIAGSILIAIVLLAVCGFHRPEGWGILFNTTSYETGQPARFSGFALSLLMGAWCLTGFEAAADLAEETHQPRKTVPPAILGSLLGSGIGGFFLLLAFILAIGDLATVQASNTPLLDIIQVRLGAGTANALMIVVFISILACSVASMAAATRLIFSLSRDRMLPGSSFLAKVNPAHATPVYAIGAVWLVSSAVVLGLEKLAIITSISAVSGYLGYAGILWAALASAKRGAWDESDRQVGGEAMFRLGRWRRPIGVGALIWTLLLTAALTIPPVDGGHLPAITSTVACALGVAIYFVLIRRRIFQGTAGPPQQKDEP